MFTGIITGIGKVQAIERQPAGARLVIAREGFTPAYGDPAPGESICVSGVCLTLVSFDQATMCFDVVGETLARSTLGTLKPGDPVNLEASLTPNTPMGGHFVQGHVDGIGTVARIQTAPEDWRIAVEPPAELMPCMVPKGSVAVEGVSLTIATVTDRQFEVAIIPTTLKQTTLSGLKPGDAVNLEADIVARTIVHWLEAHGGGGGSTLTLDKLRAAGFGES